MANSSGTDHNCKFSNNIVFMFQIVNDAKSTPFAPAPYKTFMYTPQSNQKVPTFGKLCKIHQLFLFRTEENGTSKVYSELRKICPIRPPLLIIT